MGLLVSLPAWTEESNADKINAEELKELSMQRKVVKNHQQRWKTT